MQLNVWDREGGLNSGQVFIVRRHSSGNVAVSSSYCDISANHVPAFRVRWDELYPRLHSNYHRQSF